MVGLIKAHALLVPAVVLTAVCPAAAKLPVVALARHPATAIPVAVVAAPTAPQVKPQTVVVVAVTIVHLVKPHPVATAVAPAATPASS